MFLFQDVPKNICLHMRPGNLNGALIVAMIIRYHEEITKNSQECPKVLLTLDVGSFMFVSCKSSLDFLRC